jgi:hypothetical protein
MCPIAKLSSTDCTYYIASSYSFFPQTYCQEFHMMSVCAEEIQLVKSEMPNCSDLFDIYNHSDMHVSIFEHAKQNKHSV